jgi:nicotinamidase-related amidase
VSKEFSGNIWPQILDVFPDQQPIERTSLNAWDDKAFVTAVKATGKRNLIVAALWTEVCLVFPTLHAIWDGYNVFAVEDASGGMSETAHHAGIRRIEAAGAISMTAIQVLLEFQRDWARHDHYADAMEILKTHGGAYGQGVEYASTMLHELPPSRHALVL